MDKIKLIINKYREIISFSSIPLVISSITGIVFCFISFIYMIIVIAKTIIFGDLVSGFPTIVCQDMKLEVC